jgi:hypothetical protein
VPIRAAGVRPVHLHKAASLRSGDGLALSPSRDLLASGGYDELRDLRAWLTQQDQLRGRVTLTQDGPPEPGALGIALEDLSVSIESGGAVTVLIAGIMSWIRQRYGQRRRNRGVDPPARTGSRPRQPGARRPAAIAQFSGYGGNSAL